MNYSDSPSNPYIIDFDSHEDLRGSLFTIDFKNIPFLVKRFFSITVNDLTITRGNHAHKECWQLLIPDRYGFSVKIQNVNSAQEFNPTLGQGLIIPPENWCSLTFNSINSSINVVASHEFDANDYIVEPPR